jgi:hypothetical protein
VPTGRQAGPAKAEPTRRPSVTPILEKPPPGVDAEGKPEIDRIGKPVFEDLEKAEGATGDVIQMVVGGRRGMSGSLSFSSGGLISSTGDRGKGMRIRFSPGDARRAFVYSEIWRPPLALREEMR